MPEYELQGLNHRIAPKQKWVINLSHSIKNTFGKDCSLRRWESKGELITQGTFRYPDNQFRTAANMNLAWNTKNTKKL